MCVFVSVSLTLRITSGMMWGDTDPITQVTQIISMVNGSGLSIYLHHENELRDATI